MKIDDVDKMEEIYLVLSDLRYLRHKESNTFENYRGICVQYYHRIAAAARYAGDMLPPERFETLDTE